MSANTDEIKITSVRRHMRKLNTEELTLKQPRRKWPLAEERGRHTTPDWNRISSEENENGALSILNVRLRGLRKLVSLFNKYSPQVTASSALTRCLSRGQRSTKALCWPCLAPLSLLLVMVTAKPPEHLRRTFTFNALGAKINCMEIDYWSFQPSPSCFSLLVLKQMNKSVPTFLTAFLSFPCCLFFFLPLSFCHENMYSAKALGTPLMVLLSLKS